MKRQNVSLMSKAGFAVAAALTLMPTYAISAEMGAVDEPIKLAINEWTGQHVTTRVAGEVLSRMGYNVEYVTAGYYPQMTALEDNTISASLEIWTSNIGELMTEALDSGNVVSMGDLKLTISETWWFNDAAKEACPALPAWTALKDCGELLAVAETYPNGRLLDYPVEWGTTNVDRISALDLPLKSVPAGSEGSLVVEIKAAQEKNEPLLVMFWTPHWLHAEVPMQTIDLPEYYDGCFEDAALGSNPDKTYDCDWPSGHAEKLAWVGFEEKWPAAYALLSAYEMTTPQQVEMLAKVDNEGEDLEVAVNAWLDANEAVWKPWVESASN